jgi:hypothetical protein
MSTHISESGPTLSTDLETSLCTMSQTVTVSWTPLLLQDPAIRWLIHREAAEVQSTVEERHPIQTPPPACLLPTTRIPTHTTTLATAQAEVSIQAQVNMYPFLLHFQEHQTTIHLHILHGIRVMGSYQASTRAFSLTQTSPKTEGKRGRT